MNRNILASPYDADFFQYPVGEAHIDNGQTVFTPNTTPGVIDHTTNLAEAPAGFDIAPTDQMRLTTGEADAIEVVGPHPQPTGELYTPENDSEDFWPGAGALPRTTRQERIAQEPESRRARLVASAKRLGNFVLGRY